MLTTLDPLSWFVVLTSVLVAALVRGYSGFGFAMIAVTGFSLVLPPSRAVPLVLILEVLASIQLLPQIRRQVDWPSLRWLLAGAVPATPLGVYLLASIPAAPLQIAIALIVLTLAITLLSGWAWQQMPGRTLTFATGTACGLLNGAAAIGGPPVIIFYLSSPAGVAVSRASIIAYFFGIDLFSLAIVSLQGLIFRETALIAMAALPPLFVGVGLGKRLFSRTDPERFRRGVLILLMAMSCAVLLRNLSV